MTLDLIIKKISEYTIVDVRSPLEYFKGHIPSAINIPLFTDTERAVIGTIYKQQGKKPAIEKGLGFVDLSNLVEKFKPLDKPIILYCARGGMRSSSIAWLLELMGHKVLVLKGGYKTFRRWAIDKFKKNYDLMIIGGYTCVGKTEIIKSLTDAIDLESLANHNGSVFGGLKKTQPTQEHFENLLAVQLFLNNEHRIYIEDESRFIGKIQIPNDFYIQMRKSPILILTNNIENRTIKCLNEYKNIDKDYLKKSTTKLEKKLGSNKVKYLCRLIDEEKYKEACHILFTYYDKSYSIGISKRAISTISYLEINKVATQQICNFILKKKTQENFF